MPQLTPERQLKLIKIETNTLDDSTVDETLPYWWDEFEGDPYQYAKTKRKVLLYLLAKFAARPDVQIGTQRITYSQRFANAQKLLAELDNEYPQITAVDNNLSIIIPSSVI